PCAGRVRVSHARVFERLEGEPHSVQDSASSDCDRRHVDVGTGLDELTGPAALRGPGRVGDSRNGTVASTQNMFTPTCVDGQAGRPVDAAAFAAVCAALGGTLRLP